jgi:hypothetical protein
VQWTWWQVGERLRARRPHWTMTRGVACWSEPYLRATRSFEERKRGIAPVTAGKGRAFTGTSPAARIQAYSWRSQPGQSSRVERGRKQRSCCSLVCSMTETKKHLRVNVLYGQCCLPLRGGSISTNGASTSPSRSNKQRRWIEGFRRLGAAGLSSWIGEGNARRSNGSTVVRAILR